jgi:hypothetical protein
MITAVMISDRGLNLGLEIAPRDRRRCSIFPLSLLAAYFVFDSVTFFSSIEDARHFIVKTGGQHCWLYGNADTYIYYHLAELATAGFALFLVWLLGRDGKCVLATGVASMFFLLWAFQWVANALSCWN